MRAALAASVAAGLAVAAGCAPAWKHAPHDRVFQREAPRLLHLAPPERSPSDWWDYGLQTTVRPLGRALSPARYLASAIGGRPAQDVNAFGQVPDSGWFENRVSRRDYSSDEVSRGAARSDGPADGPLRIIDGKVEGASPGFIVRDSAGDVWFVKLDPPAFPQLSTSAEVVASRLLWLAGYHVPEMHALDIDVARFVLDADARKRDDYNRRVPLLPRDLDALFSGLNPNANNEIRAMFSRRLDGQILGPFAFRGTRSGDPNDRIDHQHRRSLRGLWLFFAWLNNTDARQQNTLDVHHQVTADGRGFIRHFLIDFGDSFGAAGTREKVASEGHQYVVDWLEIGANLFTAGLRFPRWLSTRRSRYRSVGRFGSEAFEPAGWKPEFPNPAFSEKTREDVLWAASILARISPRHIRAAVSAGRYSEPGAADYIIRTLIGRRARVLRWALLDRVAIDRPRLEGDVLVVDDLRALAGLPPIPLSWRARWNRSGRGDRRLDSGQSSDGRVDLGAAFSAARGASGFDGDPFITVTFGRTGVREEVEVHLRITRDRAIPVGLVR